MSLFLAIETKGLIKIISNEKNFNFNEKRKKKKEKRKNIIVKLRILN